METTLQHILSELQHVREELGELRQASCPDQRSVEVMLRRRGFSVLPYTSPEHLILPKNCSKETENEFYRLLKKYSFRIFLRDLITYSQTPRPELLTRYCSERAAHQYLATLLRLRLLQQPAPACYTFTANPAPFFGDTFEWFIAEVLQREFGSPALWGIRLKNSTAGGDYDVIAAVENRFAYLEVKSSPPKHIDMSEVRAFFDRVQELQPDFAIFLEDTHLRMQDKLVVMFEAELARRYGESAPQTYPVQRLRHEIFAIKNMIFLTNTKPDLVSNLGVCLKHFFARGLKSV
jgi:hypothetical protein